MTRRGTKARLTKAVLIWGAASAIAAPGLTACSESPEAKAKASLSAEASLAASAMASERASTAPEETSTAAEQPATPVVGAPAAVALCQSVPELAKIAAAAGLPDLAAARPHEQQATCSFISAADETRFVTFFAYDTAAFEAVKAAIAAEPITALPEAFAGRRAVFVLRGGTYYGVQVEKATDVDFAESQGRAIELLKAWGKA